MNRELWNKKLSDGSLDAVFTELYGSRSVGMKERYKNAIDSFCELYGDGDIRIFSAPGRTEIAGNHTDHNNGIVLAGSVNLDMIAVAVKTDNECVTLKSEGYDKTDKVNLDNLDIVDEEKEHSASLIRGVAKAFTMNNGKVGGFNAYTTNDVLRGSGLSSSAAFEVCIGEIFNGLYNDHSFNPIKIAQFGQYAENVYFGKPSGLMDQMACAVGGIVRIDFKDTANPVVEQLDFNLGTHDLELCITDTGGNHADLTADYASIPIEMKAVAAMFDKSLLREIPLNELVKRLPEVRSKLGDRAAMRALHFNMECTRVDVAYTSAKENNIKGFLETIKECGHSSFEFLQNAYKPEDSKVQNIPLALCISRLILADRGACRLQGGGFAGTIQAFVPKDLADEYQAELEKVFGDKNCHRLSIRPIGICEVLPS